MVAEQHKSFETALEECRTFLEKCCESKVLSANDWAQNRLIGFNLWADGVGAFAQGSNAIRKKLINSSQTFEILTFLVDCLSDSAAKCQSIVEQTEARSHIGSPAFVGEVVPDPSKNSLTEARAEVESLIHSLVDLGLVIRRAGRSSRLSKADASFSGAEYLGLEKQLEIVLQSHTKFDLSEATSDTSACLVLQAGLRSDQRRLIEVNLRRRHRFAWARRRFNSLRDSNHIFADAKPVVQVTEEPSHSKKTPKVNIVHQSSNHPTSEPVATQKSVSTINPKELNVQTNESRPSYQAANLQRYTPSAHLTAVTAKLEYPRPPAIVRKTGTHQFSCPCCWETWPVETGRDMKKWRAHIAHDLQPYTCPHGHCTVPDLFFTTKKSLLEHLKENHEVAVSWQCFLCVEDTSYDSPLDFETHIRTQHRDEAPDEAIASIVRVCSIKTIDIPRLCPICNDTLEHFEREDGNETFLDHICRHIHDFSLRALPWNDRNLRSDVEDHFQSALSTDKPKKTKVDELGFGNWMIQKLLGFEADFIDVDRPKTPPQNEELSVPVEPSIVVEPNERPKSPDVSLSQRPVAPHPIDVFDTNIEFDRLSDDKFFEDKDSINEAPLDDVPPYILTNLLREILDAVKNYSSVHSSVLNTYDDDMVPVLENLSVLQSRFDVESSATMSGWQAITCQLAREDGLLMRFQDALKTRLEPDVVNRCCKHLNQLLVLILSMNPETEKSKMLFAIANCTGSMESNLPNSSDNQPQSDSSAMQISKALYHLPATLDETYERMLLQIGKVHKALNALRWLAFETRPLTLGELNEACLITYAEDELVDINNRGQAADILEILAGLILIEDLHEESDSRNDNLDATSDSRNDNLDATSDPPFQVDSTKKASRLQVRPVNIKSRVRFVRVSIREYLLSDRISNGRATMFALRRDQDYPILAQSCLAYVLYYSQSSSKTKSEEDLLTFPFLEYAAQAWTTFIQNSDQVQPAHQIQLLESKQHRQNWLAIHQPDKPWVGQFESELDVGSALYYASYIGVVYTCRMLLDRGADVNAQGGFHGNALQAASGRGHQQVVQLLLDRGANIHAQGVNALQAALEGGHQQVSQLLLDNGADVNAQGGKLYGNTLLAASGRGHQQVVQLLLDRGADVNAQVGEFYGNALQAASGGGHQRVVQLLLDSGADVNAQGGYYGNALYAASGGGNQDVVQLLLEAGADVNAQGGELGNALQAASERGHQQVVQLLLDSGADVNAPEGYYGNALQAASYGGHQQVVQLLLDAGADVNAQGGEHGNALQAALERGHQQVVQLLQNAGAHSA